MTSDYERYNALRYRLIPLSVARLKPLAEAIRHEYDEDIADSANNRQAIGAYLSLLRTGDAVASGVVNAAAAAVLDVPLSVFLGDPDETIVFMRARDAVRACRRARNEATSAAAKFERADAEATRLLGTLDAERAALISTVER